MAQGISFATIEDATGKSWDEWLKLFESIGAKDLTHKEIANRIYELGAAPAWWCQMVTVAYEQHIGRRVPGQTCAGKYAISVTKTLTGTIDEALERWLAFVATSDPFSGIELSRGPEVSRTEKWRYWRCGLGDGSRVNVNIYQKAPSKAALSCQHEAIETEDEAEAWRARWKNLFAGFE